VRAYLPLPLPGGVFGEVCGVLGLCEEPLVLGCFFLEALASGLCGALPAALSLFFLLGVVLFSVLLLLYT
jgi:hypothetical protein